MRKIKLTNPTVAKKGLHSRRRVYTLLHRFYEENRVLKHHQLELSASIKNLTAILHDLETQLYAIQAMSEDF